MSTALIDCDGVLADFSSAYLDIFNNYANRDLVLEDITHFNFFDSPKFQEVAKSFPSIGAWMDHYITHTENFVDFLDPLPGAYEGLEALRDAGHRVVCVTSPWSGSKFWHYERVRWLEDEMGFANRDIIFAHDKSLIYGDVLVDDKIENIVNWGGSYGLLWDQPWNRSATELMRVKTWEEVLKWVEQLDHLWSSGN